MEDPNSIAWLYAAQKHDQYTLESIRRNSEGYNPQQQNDDNDDMRSRESTAPKEDLEDERIHLRFDMKLKGGLGLVFGTDTTLCDIVLKKLPHISRRHCYLTFDAEHRLILRDFSTHGTIVTYHPRDKKPDQHRPLAGELRRNFTWILSGHKVLNKPTDIIIEIQGIRFRINVPTHKGHSDLYRENVERFLGQAGDIGGSLFNGLGISSPTPEEERLLREDSILIEHAFLGEGTYAVVHHHWDVSTGQEYALKKPNPKREDINEGIWEREIDLLRSISHDHIVALLDYTHPPQPLMVLEYVPLGTLTGCELSLEESMTVLYQGLSALTYLHGHIVPIVHRDIKPGNILVKSLKPLHVKLADFGLSRASEDLTTICGTAVYMAPEIFHHGRSYTPAVDVWSLGLVAYECAYSLPVTGNCRIGEAWCRGLVAKINDEDDGDLVNLLTRSMVIMDPRMRSSAEKCYEEASKFVADSEKRCTTPTPQSYNAQDNKSSSARPTDDSEATEQESSQEESSQEESSQQNNSSAKEPSSHAPPSPSTSKRAPPSSLSPSARTIKRHRYPTSSGSDLNLFNSNWLEDPNCVGSEVAAMGKDGEEPSEWTTDSQSKSTPGFQSKSKSKSDPRHMPRTMPDDDTQPNPNDEATLDAHAIALLLGAIEAPDE
ncbi:kinase-like domain protein [Rutstroemia sp. NJR-2017a WRK4]|nr:kinase-like domain protein [Rutstroemia sp. NJR-2017a WRK4]